MENILEKWAPEVNHSCPKVPIVLVGNKKVGAISNQATLIHFQDLRNDPNTIKELGKMKQEPVTPEEGRAMAERINAIAYLECSAKSKEGVREVFETATRAALMVRPFLFHNSDWLVSRMEGLFHSTNHVFNKLAKLGDAIAFSKSETINHSLIDPLTDRGNC